MATSNTTNFDLNVDDLIEESYERCGMRMTAGYQLNSARRSLNLLFLDWANRGLNLWTIEQASLSLVASTNNYNLDNDVVNVLTAVVNDTNDIAIDRISRAEYLNLPNKTTTGRPAQYYVERTNVPKIYVYPTPDKAYTFKYYRIRRIQDSGDYTNTLDVNFRFLPCLSAGLAYYLSLKFAPERTQILKGFYEEEFARAAAEDRDTASVSFVPQVGS
jgi:hypothetical protein